MLWSSELATVRRCLRMRYWEAETAEEQAADAPRQGPRLESVADHSWQLCDWILTIAPHFPELDISKSLALAVVHDKLELLTGDLPPIGMHDSGEEEAQDTERQQPWVMSKREKELNALSVYLLKGNSTVMQRHEMLFREYMTQSTAEAMFVSAVDKLLVYSFLLRKKRGNMADSHIRFTLDYTREHVIRVPKLIPFSLALENRLLKQIAEFRNVSQQSVNNVFGWPGDLALGAASRETRRGQP